jgi:hypothetical protein
LRKRVDDDAAAAAARVSGLDADIGRTAVVAAAAGDDSRCEAYAAVDKAATHVRTGDLQAVAAALAVVRRTHPTVVRVHTNAATVALRRGRYAACLRACAHALALLGDTHHT